jgi:hypothetical protein
LRRRARPLRAATAPRRRSPRPPSRRPARSPTTSRRLPRRFGQRRSPARRSPAPASATGTKIVSQLTPLLAGEALGGIGRYRVNIPEQSVASTALSGTYGILTVGGTVTGSGFGSGQSISGTNVVAGTTVYGQLTGTAGGAGTYVVDNNTVVASTAITAQASIETPWIAKSAGAVGELIKISRTS